MLRLPLLVMFLLGAASVRIQGMRGRYTRFLSDGLPLFGEQVGALSLLQIPPMDLSQVEVIKGVASSLYGAGAMGGVVNLIARRPGAEAQQEFLLNRSTRGATDAVAWLSQPLSRGWGFTLLAGGHWQDQPYRTSSESYMIVGMMGEKPFGRVRLFVNGENLTGVRQTKWDPLLRPDRAPDGRWTVDAWAPLDGRTVNGGVRLMF